MLPLWMNIIDPTYSLSLSTMKVFCILLFFDTVSAILVGRVINCTYDPTGITPITSQRMSCESCLCDAISLYNSSSMALNCFEHGKVCELFLNVSLVKYSLSSSSNSTCYFHANLFDTNVMDAST